MCEIICESLAHRAGFSVSVGNWIAPDGTLISGESYESHHWETLVKHLTINNEIENHLQYMNEKVAEGYIRLVFRADVLFQVGCAEMDALWSESPNYGQMIEILKKLGDVDIHIFSSKFYIIGSASKIVSRMFGDLQIRVA